jgi:hypothetical protein
MIEIWITFVIQDQHFYALVIIHASIRRNFYMDRRDCRCFGQYLVRRIKGRRQLRRSMSDGRIVFKRIVTYTTAVCGSVTNNTTTKVRIGYQIYSLWRFIAAHITITSY